MSDVYVKPVRLSLRAHPQLTEKWVQNLIINDPTIIGLGDLVFRAQERMQPRAGRLDLLLQHSETKRRYEVELQLGATDEAHIIRTVEYWDIERKRYPQYDHCAVLIAEDITSRFLNVISLFNGVVPLIAIQMQAVRIGEHLSLIFTKVVDELSRGVVDEDEDAEAAPTDRAYWDAKASKATVALADDLLGIVKGFDPSLELKYNKFYIGLSKNGLAYNFVSFKPKKEQLRLEIKLPETDDVTAKIENAGLETLEYNEHWGLYKVRLTAADLKTKREVISELMRLAYERRAAMT
jgi:predicted transport protein